MDIVRNLLRISPKKTLGDFYKTDFGVNYMLNRSSTDHLIPNKIFGYVDYPGKLMPLSLNPRHLEPVFKTELFEKHHRKYLASCVKNYNKAVELYYSSNIPRSHESVVKAINHYGGSLVNHQVYFNTIAPQKMETSPGFDLFRLIQRDFGSTSKLIDELKDACMDIKGYGWAWFGYDLSTNGLTIATTKDEIALQMSTGILPIFGIDMWEHAFYDQFKNVKTDYISSVIVSLNWNHANLVLKEYQKLAFELHQDLD